LMRICELSCSAGPLRYLMVSGIRPKASYSAQVFLREIGKISGVSVQVMDAGFVAGYEHIITAGMLAAKSWGSNANLSRSPAIEILLYASGRRQIKEAISKVGVNGESLGWVVMAVSASESKLRDARLEFSKFGVEDDGLIELTDSKINGIMEKFAITDSDLIIAEQLTNSKADGLKSLVLEKVALSELYR